MLSFLRPFWPRVESHTPSQTPHTLRRALTHSMLTQLLGKDEPYVLNGRWSWFPEDDIFLVYPDLGLCVVVYPEGITDEPKSELRLFCEENKIGLLEIFWDAPLTVENLRLCLKGMRLAS